MTNRLEELTPSEKRKLTAVITGYGKLKTAAHRSGLHVHTIRNISRMGYGEPESIQIIRSTLLGGEAKVNKTLDNQKTAA